MKHIFYDINGLLASGEEFVLASIIRHAGSSPRSTGTRMAVRLDGSILGTIGGGQLEAQVIEHAGRGFENRGAWTERFNFNAQKASSLGMICGGRVTVLYQIVAGGDPAWAALYQSLVSALETRRNAWLCTRIDRTGSSIAEEVVAREALVLADGAPIGDVGLGEARLLEACRRLEGRDPAWVDVDGQALLVEPVRTQGTAILCGGGHIAEKLAPLTGWVGFYTVVIDDRPDFANRERFATADDVRVAPGFRGVFDADCPDGDTYLVIVTRGHLDDQAVLEQALRTPAGYIGMIGSRRKTELIFRDLLEKGYSREDLARIHAPIGLPIGAETPEEIAISILAELIQARAGKLSG